MDLFRNLLGRDSIDAATTSDERFLIVGLGNPGREYQKNRHNIGFMAVDRLAARHHIDLKRVQNRAVVGNGRINQRSVILAKPQTFMNLSGDAVGPLINYYRIQPARMLVIYDELDIPFGMIRLRQKGGAGGHNGMRSIIRHAGDEFPRLRLGIGRPPGRMEAAAYVLQDFGREEQMLLDEMLDKAVAAVESYLIDGIELAMTRFNGTVDNQTGGSGS